MGYYKVSNLYRNGNKHSIIFKISSNSDINKIKPLIDSKLLNIDNILDWEINICDSIYNAYNCVDMINTIMCENFSIKIDEDEYQSHYTFPAGFKLSRVDDNKYEVFIDNNINVLFNFMNSLIGSVPMFKCELTDNKFYITLNEGFELNKLTIVSKTSKSTYKPLKEIITLDVNWI